MFFCSSYLYIYIRGIIGIIIVVEEGRCYIFTKNALFVVVLNKIFLIIKPGGGRMVKIKIIIIYQYIDIPSTTFSTGTYNILIHGTIINKIWILAIVVSIGTIVVMLW